MFCHQCGKDLPNDSKFCENCGARLMVLNENNVDMKSKTKSEKESSLGDDNFIFGYVLDESNLIKLSIIREALEKKNDYKIEQPDLIKKDIYVYSNSKGKSSGVIILVNRDNKIYIIGNENGLITIRSRYLNKNLNVLKKEKIYYSNISESLTQLKNLYKIPKGKENENLIGVGGWLTYFIIGLFISSISSIFISFADFEIYSLLDIGIAIYAFYVTYLLIKIKPKALINIRILLSIYAVIHLLTIISSPETILEEDSFFNPVRGLLLSFVWLIYFKVSKRVRATYSS